MAYDPISGKKKPNRPIGQPGVKTGDLKLSSPSRGASKVTFGEAFKEARKKGEGTKFTWEGKQYTAVTKDDLKKKGFPSLAAYNKADGKSKTTGGKAGAGSSIKSNAVKKKARKRPIITAIKKVLLGKDQKFGGDKGAIDFIRRPKKKASSNSKKKSSGGAPKTFKAGGLATKGLGKAYINSKR